MFRNIIFLFPIVFSVTTTLAHGDQNPENKYLSYQDAAVLALEKNPDILAIREQEASFKFKSIQAIAPNEPQFSLTQTDVPNPSIFSQGGATVYGISWTLGFPGKAMYNSRQLEQQAMSQKEIALQKELELLTSLSNIYVELSVNENLLKSLNQELVRANQTVFITEKRYSSAQAAQTDILNARFYKASVEHDILTQEAAKESFLIQFRTLLRRSDDQNLFPKISTDWTDVNLDKSYPELKELLLNNRPQLRALNYQTQASKSLLSLSSLSLFPDIQINAAMNDYHVIAASPLSVSRSYSIGVNFNIPIFFPLNEVPGIEAAKKDYATAVLNEESAKTNILADLQNTTAIYVSNKKLYDSSRNIVLPAALANYQLAMKSYELGKLNYLNLLDARKAWLQSERDVLDRKKQLAESINQITLSIGCEWTRKGVPHACR